MLPTRSEVETTFKSRDTEETLDKIFYRPLGYAAALIAKKLRITPNAVTILSIFAGVAAGNLFYYENIKINVAGILLLVFADILDSADGQLARMTNTHSKFGRILDGFGGNLWFVSIYIHICLRLMNQGWPIAVFGLAVAAGASHSMQSAIADYYRNYYLCFVYGKEKSEIDISESLIKEYKKYSWSKNFFKKFLMRVYLNYTLQQEAVSQKSLKLLKYESNMPAAAQNKIPGLYRTLNKKYVKYYNILTTNTRLFVLFISLFINLLPLYFIFELTVLNILMIYVIRRQEKNSEEILNNLISLKGI